MRQFFMTVPNDIDAAASAAGEFGIVWRIMLPRRHALIAFAIFRRRPLGDCFWPLIVVGSELYTPPLASPSSASRPGWVRAMAPPPS
jgi:ABC-type glycerol-3-phosphate transport system permease component